MFGFGPVYIKAKVVRSTHRLSYKKPDVSNLHNWESWCWSLKNNNPVYTQGTDKLPTFLMWYYKKYHTEFEVFESPDKGNSTLKEVLKITVPNSGDIIVMPDKSRYLCVKNPETGEITTHLIQTDRYPLCEKNKKIL